MSIVKLIASQLLDECVQHIEDSETIYLLISFVMESGVELLAPSLRVAAKGGADIKILTGDYLYVTQPEALRELREIHPAIEVRLWNSHGVSFHPKAYLFRKRMGDDVVIVGSSNLSRSALTTGVEWSLSVSAGEQDPVIEEAEEKFFRLFNGEQTIPVNPISIEQYQREYEEYHSRHPDLARTWALAEGESRDSEPDDGEELDLAGESTIPYDAPIAPRPAQVEALEQLQITRAEGYDKALVVMATGLGKTYLAALFAKGFRRVLFIAHREEILLQAKEAFALVSPEKSSGLFTGRDKEDEADIILASVFTLGRKRYRTRFGRRRFDLIIVDEFHHAAAATYQAVMDWFHPKFLLGITATPDRLDGRDVYALCDGNVAYKMEFLEAIGRGWLAPFHYVGVYDETDYSQIRWLGSRYDEQELLFAQTRDGVADAVQDAWDKYAQSRGLAFCSSVAQARFLAHHFEAHGVRCVCVHGGSSNFVRSASIRKLHSGELDLIFTVDLFNEGVDIPAVDTLLFVRPTESLTVFTQQVGRGLRPFPGKSHCTIIDVIGNYRNADLKLSLFDAAEAAEVTKSSRTIRIPPEVPVGCEFHLDLKVVDLIRAMQRKRHPRRERLRESYQTVKFNLGRRPTYEEMHLLGTTDSRELKQEYGSYVGFLAAIGELDEDEMAAFRRFEPWLQEVESTSMSKSYKMVLLLAMLERGIRDWHKPVTTAQLAPFFHAFYMAKEYRRKIDFSDKDKAALADYDEHKVASLMERNPMRFWSGSSKGFAQFDGGRFGFRLDVPDGMAKTLYAWTREVCEYRLHGYFERKGQRHI